MALKKQAYTLLMLLVIPGLMWLNYNQAAHWHLHVLKNGLVVEHAHPFKNIPVSSSEGNKHHHTEREFHFWSLLNIAAAIVFIALVLLVFQQRITPLQESLPIIPCLTFTPSENFRRGPPSSF